MSLRLASHPVNINIIQVYAPTSDYDDEEVGLFYIEETMEKVHKKIYWLYRVIGMLLLEIQMMNGGMQ